MVRAKTLRGVLVGLVATSAIWIPTSAGASAATAPAPCGAAGRNARQDSAFEIVKLHTLHVEMKARKPVYKRGQVALIDMKVSRPAKQDPAGLGQDIDPPRSEPASDVDVGIGAFPGDVYLYGTGVTDDKGQTTIKIEIPSYTPKGPVPARALAQKEIVNIPCLVIYEYGYTETKKLFTVK